MSPSDDAFVKVGVNTRRAAAMTSFARSLGWEARYPTIAPGDLGRELAALGLAADVLNDPCEIVGRAALAGIARVAPFSARVKRLVTHAVEIAEVRAVEIAQAKGRDLQTARLENSVRQEIQDLIFGLTAARRDPLCTQGGSSGKEV